MGGGPTGTLEDEGHHMELRGKVPCPPPYDQLSKGTFSLDSQTL